MSSTRHLLLFLYLAVLVSTECVRNRKSLQLQVSPFVGKLPLDDSSDTVLRRVKRQRRRLQFRNKGVVTPFCDKFGCRSGRNSGGSCGSGARFDRRSGRCRRLGNHGDLLGFDTEQLQENRKQMSVKLIKKKDKTIFFQ
ncbi:hypothetical protein JTE90_018421 [Oedothorax gibbosus]|uniref:Uncharacterized protein n=1 Tax=Oedothorax gibbosus TaxID=931172 RepID=A0AAV6TXE0_9ARAC|nr:hypothetical protein JTE90_018421 [Oedothorax gibbosus]